MSLINHGGYPGNHDDAGEDAIIKRAADVLLEVWLDRASMQVKGLPEEHCDAMARALADANVLKETGD